MKKIKFIKNRPPFLEGDEIILSKETAKEYVSGGFAVLTTKKKSASISTENRE